MVLIAVFLCGMHWHTMDQSVCKIILHKFDKTSDVHYNATIIKKIIMF